MKTLYPLRPWILLLSLVALALVVGVWRFMQRTSQPPTESLQHREAHVTKPPTREPLAALDRSASADAARARASQHPQHSAAIDHDDGQELATPLLRLMASHPKLIEGQRRDSEGLIVEQRADGSQSMALRGRFRHQLVAVPDATGKVRAACVGSSAEAAHLLARPPQ